MKLEYVDEGPLTIKTHYPEIMGPVPRKTEMSLQILLQSPFVTIDGDIVTLKLELPWLRYHMVGLKANGVLVLELEKLE
jgi:hypothetical protein